MKTILLSILFIFNSFLILAQFGPQQIISIDTNYAKFAIPFDVDNDGLIDIVSAMFSEGKIVWYKNQDGAGNFSSEIIINNDVSAIDGMELFDINDDGKKDILFKTNLDEIAWIENLDGQGGFGVKNIISNSNYPYFINAADMDGDGDQDVLSIIFQEGIIWFENTDGQGTFNSGTIIDIDSEYLYEIAIFDLDNDGDQDIISAFNNGPATLIWYENLDGLGNFDTSKEIYQFAYSSSWTTINSIIPTDINNDGKIDILFDSALEDIDVLDLNIYWIENLDNQGLFGNPIFITNQYTAAGSLRAFDIDNDGDKDVLAAHYDDTNSKISWYKNTDGAGLFASEQIITTQVERVYEANAGDINNDGLLDVISASSSDYKIAWYENGVLGIDDNNKQTAILYPNPTKNKVSISSEIDIETIEIYNILGERLTTNLQNNTVDLSNFNIGVYFLKTQDVNGSINTYKIIKE